MAAGLIEVMSLYQPKSTLHIVQMADTPSYFDDQIQRFHPWMERLTQATLPIPNNYTVIRPVVAKSFGALNSGVLREIQTLAREEGIIADPVYTGKLFLTAKTHIKEKGMKGRHLIIHTGGGMGLMGFGEAIEKLG